MTRTLLSALTLLVTNYAFSQLPDVSRLWIYIDDHHFDTYLMDYGNAVYATYDMDDGMNGTVNYGESTWPAPPPFGLYPNWYGIAGRSPRMGLFPRDYRGIPGNSAMKDTFVLGLDCYAIDDSIIYLSWPDSMYLHAKCDSMFLSYTDTVVGTQIVNMFTQSTLIIPSKTGIEYIRIYKYGVHIVDAVNDPRTVKPQLFALRDAWPNPFNSQTNISYTIPSRTHVSLKVHDLLGREVSVLVDEDKSAGSYTATWNAATAASGVYFYTIKAGVWSETKKVQLVK